MLARECCGEDVFPEVLFHVGPRFVIAHAAKVRPEEFGTEPVGCDAARHEATPDALVSDGSVDRSPCPPQSSRIGFVEYSCIETVFQCPHPALVRIRDPGNPTAEGWKPFQNVLSRKECRSRLERAECHIDVCP